MTQYDYDSATNLYWYYDGDYKLELHIDKYKVTERKDLESVSSQQAYNKKTYSYQEERELVSHPVVLYETSADKMAYVSDEDGTYLYGYLEDGHFAKLLKCGTYSKGTLYEYTGISRNKWYPRVSREEVREYDTAGSPNTGLTVTTNYSYSDLFHDPLEKTVEQNGQIVSKTEWSYGWPYLGYVIHSWQYNDLKEQNGGVYPEEGYNHLKKKTEWLRLPTDISEGDATITEYVYDMSSEKYKAPSEIKIYSSISPTTIEEHKKYEYNSAGEVTKLTQKADEIAPSGSDDPISVWDVTQYIYANGRDSAGVWNRTMTTRKTEEQNGQTVQTADIIDTYDAYGNQIKKSGYGVDETEYEYDFQNRVVKERHPGDNTQKTYAYEIGGVTGTRMTITDEAGAVMRVKYDSLGRYLATEIYPGGEALETERVSYDSKSRVAGKIVSKGSGSGDSFTVHTDYWPSGKIKKEEIKNQSSNVLQRVEYEYEVSLR